MNALVLILLNSFLQFDLFRFSLLFLRSFPAVKTNTYFFLISRIACSLWLVNFKFIRAVFFNRTRLARTGFKMVLYWEQFNTASYKPVLSVRTVKYDSTIFQFFFVHVVDIKLDWQDIRRHHFTEEHKIPRKGGFFPVGKQIYQAPKQESRAKCSFFQSVNVSAVSVC